MPAAQSFINGRLVSLESINETKGSRRKNFSGGSGLKQLLGPSAFHPVLATALNSLTNWRACCKWRVGHGFPLKTKTAGIRQSSVHETQRREGISQATFLRTLPGVHSGDMTSHVG